MPRVAIANAQASMRIIPAVRSSFPFVEVDFVQYGNNKYVSALVLDPFTHTVAPVSFPMSDAVVSVSAACRVLSAASVTDVRLMEDETTGDYLACIAMEYGADIAKQPGFMLWGRPVVGQALLVRGNVVRLKSTGTIYEQHQDLTESDIDQARKSIMWLNIKEILRAKRMRQAKLKEFIPYDTTSAVRLAKGPTTCHGCGLSESASQKCSRCRTVYYCSQECQRQHWPIHKQNCKPGTGSRSMIWVSDARDGPGFFACL